MHVHILTNVWDLKWHDWSTHTLCHTGISMFLCNYTTGGGADRGSQVDTNSCTDAFTF